MSERLSTLRIAFFLLFATICTKISILALTYNMLYILYNTQSHRKIHKSIKIFDRPVFRIAFAHSYILHFHCITHTTVLHSKSKQTVFFTSMRGRSVFHHHLRAFLLARRMLRIARAHKWFIDCVRAQHFARKKLSGRVVVARKHSYIKFSRT